MPVMHPATMRPWMPKGTTKLIQVCYDLSDSKTLTRESDALIEASKETGCKNLKIISWDREEKIERNGNMLYVVPAWKWLLFANPETAQIS